MATTNSIPRRQLTVWHAASVCVGMVVGAGIFSSTPAAAVNAPDGIALLFAWAAAGALSLAGALCFAEMAAAFPSTGGDYHFLSLAYGPRLGFLFAWSRFAVIHTGSMSMLAFVFSDYLSSVVHLGPMGSALIAACTVAALVGVNLAGLRFGIGAQVILTSLVLMGLASVGFAGVWRVLYGLPPATPEFTPQVTSDVHWGQSLVYIFLAYGGWSDAATLSAEMRDVKRGITRALLYGMGAVTCGYLFVNWALLRGLGFDGLGAATTPAADLMLRTFGRSGELFIVAVVAITSITPMNALLIAGARTTYAAARDTGAFGRLGDWHETRGTPAASIVAMGVMTLALIGFGAWTRQGFRTMVDYLSPVYWFFLTLSGGAYFLLRWRHGAVQRHFRAPLYPWVPLAFIASSAFVFYNSVAYVKVGVIACIVVMAVGMLLSLWLTAIKSNNHER